MTRVLGFDTATTDVAVALTDADEVVAESLVTGPAEGPPNHAATLLPEIERLVAESGGWEGVDRIAVGVGPGSYTGLRIGIATARALGQGLGKPISGVSTLAALGAGIAELPQASGQPVLPAIDARRRELFAMLIGVDGVTRWEPLVGDTEHISRRLTEEGIRPLAAGSGAIRFQGELEAAGVEVLPASDSAHRISARHICRLSARAPGGGSEDVTPVYLRPPDAERWIERDRDRPQS